MQTRDETLLKFAQERIEGALLDYKKEMHAQFVAVSSQTQSLQMQATQEMQKVVMEYRKELHEKQVQTAILNQSLQGMHTDDELHQILHASIMAHESDMLEKRDKQIQGHVRS